jgi:WD40 repeat protein
MGGKVNPLFPATRCGDSDYDTRNANDLPYAPGTGKGVAIPAHPIHDEAKIRSGTGRRGDDMPPQSVRTLVLAILLISVPAQDASSAESSPACPPIHRDRYGDPLPAGAIARLGSVRFRLDGFGEDGGVAISPDGRFVIGATGTALFWFDAASGRVHRRINLGRQWLQKMRQSPDGKTLATFSSRRDRLRGKGVVVVELWDVAAAKRRSRFELDDAGRGDFRFTSDGSRLIVGAGSAVQVWNSSGTAKSEFSAKQGTIQYIATVGDSVAIGGYYGFEIRNWKTGKRLAVSKETDLGLQALAFSPDGKSLVVAAGKTGRALALHDAATGKLLKALSPPAYTNYVKQIAFSPDGRTFAINEADRGGVEVWDVATGKRLHEFPVAPDSIRSLAFSPDGKSVAATGYGPTVHVCELASGKDAAAQRPGHRSAQQLIAFVLGGKFVATGGDDGVIRIWDPRTGKQQYVLRHGDVPKDRFNSITAWIRGLAVSPDGKLIGTSSLDDTVRIWDAATGKERLRLFGHGRLGGRRELAFTSDGKRLVSWGEGKYLRVWDVRTGKALREHALREGLDEDVPKLGGAGGPFEQPQGILSPDGTTLLNRTGTKLVVMDVETAKVRGEFFSAHNAFGNSVISPDGKLFLSCEPAPPIKIVTPRGVHSESSGDHFVLLRGLPDGKVVFKLSRPGVGGPLAFSADGKRFAAGSTKRGEPISIRDTATFRELQRIPNVSRPWSVAFSPDGKLLTAGLSDSTVLVWDLSLIPTLAGKPGQPKGAKR